METALFGDMGFGGPIGSDREIFIARSHGMFQYGGVVSAPILQALKAGRADRAVVTSLKVNYPVPLCVDSEKEDRPTRK